MRDKTVSLNDLRHMMSKRYQHHQMRFQNLQEVNQVVINGDLLFDRFPSGLSVHCCDIVENKNGSCSSQLLPCISINLLFNGQVNFSLSDNTFEFNANERPILFVNVIGQPEVFTRHLIHGHAVCKTNVTIEKSWLLSRCQTANDRAQINAIFSHSVGVYQLDVTDNIKVIAGQLLKYKLAGGVENELHAEQLTLQFINTILPLLLSPTLKEHKVYSVTSGALNKTKKIEQVADNKLKDALLAIVDDNISLKELSLQLGISVSTLQRKFKEAYQVTAIEYLRIQRLENARIAIIIDGLSIGESAYAAGYTHVANFVTAFKKHFGVTPAQLRKQHLGNNR